MHIVLKWHYDTYFSTAPHDDRQAPKTGSLLHHAIRMGGVCEVHDLDDRLVDLRPYVEAGLVEIHRDSGGPWATCIATVVLTPKGMERYKVS